MSRAWTSGFSARRGSAPVIARATTVSVLVGLRRGVVEGKFMFRLH
jgi:hypothetical protein